MRAAEREGYLKGACGNDLALRNKVEALLKANAETGSLFKSDVRAADLAATISQRAEGPRATSRATSEQRGQLIARYKLLDQIGEGGFGTVWKATDKQLGRSVALKRLLDRGQPPGDQLLEEARRRWDSRLHQGPPWCRERVRRQT